MSTRKNIIRACFAAVVAIGLAACGGGSAKSDAERETERLAAAETACTDAGGRWNADNTCTTTAELVAEVAQRTCTGAGGRWESDDTCTSAADLEMERLAGLAMVCTDAGGRWNADDTCTSAADLETERLAGLAMVCTDAGGRWNADDTCTSAADLEAGLAMVCTDAGGRWNADDTCTSAADLETERLAAAETACTDAGGRWESNDRCTSAADLEAERLAGLAMVCTDAGGRWESDDRCTSAADLETERLAAAETACTDAGGRWESDDRCTSAADLETERLAGLAMVCTDAGGRWESDDRCTSAADLEAERLAGLAMVCTDAGGRWNADDTCTDAGGLAMEQLEENLSRAQTTLAGLSATATDAERLAAEQAVRDAAKAVVDALVEADSMTSVVDAARLVLTMAQFAVDATQTRVNQVAEQARMAEEKRMRVAAEQKKIDDAEMALANAREVVAGLPDYTPDTVRVPFERAVHQAAMARVTVLENAGIPVAPADLVEARMAVTTAMADVTATQGRINAEAERQQAEMNAQKKVDDARTKLNEARTVLANLPSYVTDPALLDAQKALHEAATELVTALQDAGAPSTEVDSVRQDVMTAMNDIEATEERIADAGDLARLEKERMERADNEQTMISTAREEYMDAMAAFEALADDAFYAVRLASRKKVLDAAAKWREVVESAMPYPLRLADVDAARTAQADALANFDATESGGRYPNERLLDARNAFASATTDAERDKAKVDVLQALIDNPDATPTKQEELYQAQAALNDLAADASLEMKLAAQQKVLEAAKAWEMELVAEDAANSMVMMAQGEVDAAQMMVNMTTAMIERGTQIANDVSEANTLADALRMAAVMRSASGEGFDDDDSTNGHRVTVTRYYLSDPMMVLTGGDVADYKGGDVADYKDLTKPPQYIAGWSGYGHVFERMDETAGTTDRITVYTDIEEGMNVKLDADDAIVNAVLGITAVDSSTFVIDLDETATVVTMAAQHGVYGSGAFPSEPGTFKLYTLNVAFPGTFYGQQGTYTCTVAPCRAEMRPEADGGLTLGTGSAFTFTATAGDDDITDTQRGNLELFNAIHDSNFLYFGYWLETTKEAEATAAGAGRTFDVQMFGEGSIPYDNISTVEGSADYAGAAAGMYMREELPDAQRGGKTDDATTGTFTASVKLTAVFGGEASTLEPDKWKIRGMVEGFKNDAGRDLGWKVDLNHAPLWDDTNSDGVRGTGETVSTTDSLFTGMTEGNDSTADGTWHGQFFGPSTTVLPSGVAGEFNANFNDGYAAGAFGATRR